jgi:hypothetical protein
VAGSDARAAWTAGIGVTVVALTAAVISFEHVRALALRAGETDLTSWLLPVSLDGAVVAAVAVLLADSRAGRRPTALTLMLLAASLASSLAANIASAEPHPVARAVAAWPPVALALGIEVLAGLIRRSRPGRHQADTAGRTASEPADVPPVCDSRGGQTGQAAMPIVAAGPIGPAAEVAVTPAIPTRSTRSLDDKAAVALIQRLDADAPHGQASRPQIQSALRCGGSRAGRLAQLARQS